MLIENSRPMAEQIVRDNLFEQFRIALDEAILKGSGSGANPTGLLNATPQMSGELDAGAVDLTGAGNPWTYAKAMEFITDLANVNALRGSLGWAMSPTDWSEALQMPAGTGTTTQLARVSPQAGLPSTLVGYPVAHTTTLAHSGASSAEETVIFGDWSQIRVPFWKTLELRATDVGASTFLSDQTLVRGIMYADISIDHLQSFSIGSTEGVTF
jgi:HK97 family phage major capsid protein